MNTTKNRIATLCLPVQKVRDSREIRVMPAGNSERNAEIIELYLSGFSDKALADKFRLSTAAIYAITREARNSGW